MQEIVLTQFLRPSVGEDDGLRGVETAAAQEVSDLRSVDHSIATIPEIKQVKHVSYICRRCKEKQQKRC